MTELQKRFSELFSLTSVVIFIVGSQRRSQPCSHQVAFVAARQSHLALLHRDSAKTGTEQETLSIMTRLYRQCGAECSSFHQISRSKNLFIIRQQRSSWSLGGWRVIKFTCPVIDFSLNVKMPLLLFQLWEMRSRKAACSQLRPEKSPLLCYFISVRRLLNASLF